jgi:hypothetical protein
MAHRSSAGPAIAAALAAVAVCAEIGSAHAAAPQPATKIESSLAVEESIGPGAMSGSEIWLLVTRYESVVTTVTEPGPNGGVVSRSGDGRHLQDGYSLVRLDLLSGARRTMVEDGLIDLKSDGRVVYGLGALPKGRGFGVTAFHGESRDRLPALPLAKGDEPVALVLDKGQPVVLSHRALLRLRPDRMHWSYTTLGERIGAGPRDVAASANGGSAYLGAPKGFERIDLTTGQVTRMALPGDTCPSGTACDAIGNLAADPSQPACVLASAGPSANPARHLGVVRLCRDKIETVWRHAVNAAADAASPVARVAATSDGFWASSAADGLFLVRGADAKPFRLERARNLGGLKVSCLPNAVAVSAARTPAGESPLLLEDPDSVCRDP